jgi:hypothetical protein
MSQNLPKKPKPRKTRKPKILRKQGLTRDMDRNKPSGALSGLSEFSDESIFGEQKVKEMLDDKERGLSTVSAKSREGDTLRESKEGSHTIDYFLTNVYDHHRLSLNAKGDQLLGQVEEQKEEADS